MILEHQMWVSPNKSVFTGLHWASLASINYILFIFVIFHLLIIKYKYKNSKLKNFEGFLMTVNVVAFSDLSVAFDSFPK